MKYKVKNKTIKSYKERYKDLYSKYLWLYKRHIDFLGRHFSVVPIDELPTSYYIKTDTNSK